MAELLANNFRFRRSFAKSLPTVEVDNLIRIQRDSYEKFLQTNVSVADREPVGLQGVFRSVFPIQDFSHRASLQFVGYDLEPPKYDQEECRERGMTYSAPLKVTVRLVVWDVDTETDTRTVSNIKEQEVYFGEIPLMTENGTFIVNGTERVVVSQLHRSPGIFFDANKSKSAGSSKTHLQRADHPEPRLLDRLRVRQQGHPLRPHRPAPQAAGHRAAAGAGLLHRGAAQLLLPARAVFSYDGDKWVKETTEDLLQIQRTPRSTCTTARATSCARRAASSSSLPAQDEEGRHAAAGHARGRGRRAARSQIATIPIAEEAVLGRISAFDIVDLDTGESWSSATRRSTRRSIALLLEKGITEFDALYIDNVIVGSFLRDTLMVDKINTTEEAVIEIYRRLRPGEPPTYDAALTHFENLFFNAERYDLSKVGRLKLNHKLGLDLPLEQTTLTREDIRRVVQYLIDLKNNKGMVDDIDHLGNRRVRAVGELLENQYRIGLVRMEKAIKERMSLQEIEALMPHDLINAKPVSAVIKEFFGSSQLSQFMDQTNPLSEVTHKRRLSALGPGGLTRERAGFDVRDVHPTHYGRICPIETPEGPNIGLIASLSTYARVNEYGFIETPYRKVRRWPGHRRKSATTRRWKRRPHVIAQATPGSTTRATSRRPGHRPAQGEFAMVPRDEVTLMDVSPNQLVGRRLARALPRERRRQPRADGLEHACGRPCRSSAPRPPWSEPAWSGSSRATRASRRRPAGRAWSRASMPPASWSRPTDVDTADDIGGDVDIYNLTKFVRSNQNTCINQKPVVRPGDRVDAGDVIADGPATEQGELALGQNVVVAFMPWQGYNFEDSILISERMVREDYFTSIHIEEFEVAARDTKLGKEEITRDIPNVGEEALKNLDESGIVRIGARVRSGRHPGRQDHAEGRDPAVPRREAAARHLR